MSKNGFSIMLVGAFVASTALIAPGTASAQSITLNTAHVGTVPDHHFHKGFERFAHHLG